MATPKQLLTLYVHKRKEARRQLTKIKKESDVVGFDKRSHNDTIVRLHERIRLCDKIIYDIEHIHAAPPTITYVQPPPPDRCRCEIPMLKETSYMGKRFCTNCGKPA